MNLQSQGIITIHFDTAEHNLSLATFTYTAVAVDQIIKGLNEKMFEGKLGYEILILPPESGSFRESLAVMVVGSVLGLPWLFLESDVGKAFIKGATDHEPAYWAEIAGKNAKEAVLLTEATKGILTKDAATLSKVGIDARTSSHIYAGKNQFYATCIQDTKIRGVGFDAGSNFSVTRSEFINHTFTPTNDLTSGSELKIHELIIVSPVTAKNAKNMWKAKDKNTGEIINFYLRDDEFHWDFIAGQHPIKAKEKDDEITALIRYEHTFKNGILIETKKNAIKIYRFNETQIAEIPTNLESQNIQFNEIKNPDQQGLFDGR